METLNSNEKIVNGLNGFVLLFVGLLLVLMAVMLFMAKMIFPAIILVIAFIIFTNGFVIV